MESESVVGRREAEVEYKLKNKTWNGYYLDIRYKLAMDE